MSEHRAGPLFWLSAAVGWLVVAYGVRGLFQHRLDTRPANYARFALGGALLHDLLFAPVVLLAGYGLSQLVKGRARGPVQGGLIVSGCVLLYSYPLIRGFGHRANNPSSLPHNYTVNVAIVLAAIWFTTSIIVAVSLMQGRARDTT